MNDLLINPLPAGPRTGYLPLWFGLNAVAALAIGFVAGWAARPLARPAPGPQHAARPLPVPPVAAEAVEDTVHIGLPDAAGRLPADEPPCPRAIAGAGNEEAPGIP